MSCRWRCSHAGWRLCIRLPVLVLLLLGRAAVLASPGGDSLARGQRERSPMAVAPHPRAPGAQNALHRRSQNLGISVVLFDKMPQLEVVNGGVNGVFLSEFSI
eukprot:COSAG02_NODE_583_length_20010_cov_4.434584_8_plen_103_part_00